MFCRHGSLILQFKSGHRFQASPAHIMKPWACFQLKQAPRFRSHICRASETSTSSTTRSSNVSTVTDETSTANGAKSLQSMAPQSPGNFATAVSMDASANFIEASMCRLYIFNREQLDILKEVRCSMRNCSTGFMALAAANVLLSVVQAASHPDEGPAVIFEGLTVGDVAYWADSLMVAGLLRFAATPFDNVINRKSGNPMAYAFQGINRLGLIFQQLSIGSVAITTATALEAAAKYPNIVVFTSFVFFILAVIRATAMWIVLTKHTSSNYEITRTMGVVRGDCSPASQELPLIDKLAVMVAFGYLLEFEQKETTPASGAHGSGDVSSYEFTAMEAQVLKSMTESANTAGMALLLQAFATLMLVVAEFGINDFSGVVSNGINFTNKAITCGLIFRASQRFDRALHNPVGTDDVSHLMDGLGEEGLTGLFHSMNTLAWAVTFATLAGLAAPWLEESPLYTALSDGLSHRVAEAVVEGFEFSLKLLQGL